MEKERERLYRSKKNKIIAGVCHGLADFFGIDPVVVRLAAVLLMLADGFGIVLYIILWIILPEDPKEKDAIASHKENLQQFVQGAQEKVTEVAAKIKKDTESAPDKRKKIFGGVLIGVGALLLLKAVMPMPWVRWSFVFPLALLLLGIYLVMDRKRTTDELRQQETPEQDHHQEAKKEG